MDNLLEHVTDEEIDALVTNLLPRFDQLKKYERRERKRRGKFQVLSGEWITETEFANRVRRWKESVGLLKKGQTT